MSRFLPAASTAVTVDPTSRSARGPGAGAVAAVILRPTRYGRSPAAVRASVSPSGISRRSADGPDARRPFVRALRGRRAKREAPIAGDKSGVEERVPEPRAGNGLAVDLRDDELANAAVVHEIGKRAQGEGQQLGDLGGRKGLERGAASIHVEDRLAVDDGDVGARGPLVRALVRGVAPRPGQGGAIRVRGVGGREEVDHGRVPGLAAGDAGLIAKGAQAIDGAGERELGGTQPVDEVAPPDPA